MFGLTPFLWPFHPLDWENKIVGSAILKDQEGNILERIEVSKGTYYFILWYAIFRDPVEVNDALKKTHNNFFAALTDKLTVPIEHKNAPLESKPKFTILGEVFAPKGGLVDLKYSGHDVRMGGILYVFQDGQPVCKMVVTQAFHTKLTAKIISSSVTLAKGMQFGKLN